MIMFASCSALQFCIYRRTKPIFLITFWVVARAKGCGEQAAGTEPAGDLVEQRRLFLTRDVDDGVERRHRVEAGWRETQRRHVGLDERSMRHVFASAGDLLGGKVHAGQPESLRERAGG